ncbi:MAG TPA: bifunctional alpha,alpha-trehalose-phosphate synthase (UDP-forming)/trehalose-phosphatase, partial [Cytophagaceae bacterium]|nr:bifunctional alpha,alpha-trehalose-phosphate synthase (UDP-forming)/trehalose-phosphatase [Cytophagaceae bacterium]
MKIINISNRLPISLQENEIGIRLKNSSGGLVSAVESLRVGENKLDWVGIADFTEEEWLKGKEIYSGNFNLHPIFIEDKLNSLYYNGFANSVFWPLFHYFPSFVEYKKNYFDAYLEVNKQIAEQIYSLIDPDDLVWIHDYHLIPLVSYLRKLAPTIKIGFFLHIPFPSYELIRILPKECRNTLAMSLLGADLIGFHTYDYLQHFATTVQMIAGIQHKNFEVQYEGRIIKMEAFPISIDFDKFHDAYDHPQVTIERNKIKELYSGKKILFSVDRLDYTKGIIYRLKGYANFIEKNPEWKEKIIFILIAVPSRDSISKYAERKVIIEKLIAHINGKYGNYKWSPIVYQYGSVDFVQLVGLYTSCDIALISPIRDGMNLVAKEFVASRKDKLGVLLLSDMTGSAKELMEALLFNPLDEIEISHAINRALNMPEDEQEKRIARMQRQIKNNNVFNWSNNFIKEMKKIKLVPNVSKQLNEKDNHCLFQKYKNAKKCLFLLDYDGTLSEIKSHPNLAFPTEILFTVIRQLCNNPKNDLAIISGRRKESLEKWFGDIPLTLIAEHGMSVKKGAHWENLATESLQWKQDVKIIMERFSENCALTFVEEKNSSLSWHYRNADAEVGFAQSRELIHLLNNYLISNNLT